MITTEYLKERKTLMAKGAVDKATGVPDSYEALFSQYHNLVLNVVRKAGLPVDDWEDAAANLEFKFWQKDGLSWFDPSKGTQFSTMYRAWLSLSVLHEREKWKRYVDRYELFDPTDTTHNQHKVYAHLDTGAELTITQWASQAREVLETKPYAHLLPFFDACIEASILNEKFDHKKLAESLGVELPFVYKKLALMRNVLKRKNINPTALADLHD